MRKLIITVAMASILPLSVFSAGNGGPNGDEWNAKDVLNKMKDDGKLLAIFFHGSDWCRYGERIRKELWNAPAFRKQIEKDYYRIHSDWRDYADKEEGAYAEHLKNTAVVRKRPHIFPSITVMDAQERMCGNLAQLETRSEKEVVQWLDEVAQAVAKRDRCFKEAQSLQGMPKAEKLAEGLAALERFYAPVGQNKNYIWDRMRGWKEYKQLRKLDPDDQTGYKLHMEFLGIFKQYAKKAADAASEAEVAELAKELGDSKFLTPAQKQMAVALPYYYHQKNKDYPMMAETIKRAQQIEVVGSERERWFDLGLDGLLCMVDGGEVSVPYGWRDQHCKSVFEWKIKTGVRRRFRLPAGYRISFSPGLGNHVRGLRRQPGGKDVLAISQVQLLVDGETVWTTKLPEPRKVSVDNGEASIDLHLKQALAPDAEVEIRVTGTATGNDSRGEITITPFLELE